MVLSNEDMFRKYKKNYHVISKEQIEECLDYILKVCETKSIESEQREIQDKRMKRLKTKCSISDGAKTSKKDSVDLLLNSFEEQIREDEAHKYITLFWDKSNNSWKDKKDKLDEMHRLKNIPPKPSRLNNIYSV